MVRKLRILVVALFAMLATLAQAQVTTSGMSGRVTDREGAVIGATVVAVHVPSGTKYGTVTNQNGNFVLLGLRTGGPYKLEISYIGYENVVFDKITLQLGETSVFDAKLKESSQALTEVIVVGNKTAAFNSRRTGAAVNFGRESIERMPSVSRSIFDIAKLTPQASVTGSGLSFGGASNKFNSFQIDGTVNNDVFGLSSSGTNGGQAGANPISLEAIEEVQVVIAPFDVRQSGFTGGGVNAITKSGTNQFRGSVYNYYNDQNFVGTTAGKDVAERKALGTQMKNTFGFTIGGPIVKNKLFFFANYERANENYPSSNNVGDGSNITKEEADKVINKLKEISGGKYDGGGYGAIDIPTNSDKILARVDWNINNAHKFTTRYSFVQGSRLNFGNSINSLNLNNHGYIMNNKTHSIVAELNSRFSPEWSNELRVGYNMIRDNRQILGDPFPYVKIKLDNNRSIQLGSERFSVANTLDQDIFTFSDNLTWLKGNHTITFGTNSEFYQMKNLFIRENYGSYSYDLADFLVIGTPEETVDHAPIQYNYSFSIESITGSKRWAPKFGAAQLGFYAQDEWSVNKLLKLTYGLRVDLPIFFDKPGDNKVFNATSMAKEYEVATNQMPKTQLMYSPRIGFRYNVDESRNTLIRGGVGVFTGRIPFVWISNSFSNTGVEYSRTKIDKLSKGAISADMKKAWDEGFRFQADPEKQYVPAGVVPSEVDVVSKDFKFPQVFRANLAVEQNLPGGVRGTLEALYSKTMNNVLFQNIAYKATGENYSNGTGDKRPLYALNPDARAYNSGIIYMSNTNKGYTYNVTAKLEKSFDFGLSAMIAYTFGESKGVNDGTSSQAFSNWQYNEVYGGDSQPELAYTDFDVRHRVVGSLSYKVSYAKHYATSVNLIYSGQSGSRYSLVYNGDLNGDGARSNDLMYIPTDAELATMKFKDVTSGGKVTLTGEEQRKQFGEWINSNSDIAAYKGSYVPRNALMSQFENHFDLQFAQDFYFNVKGQRNTLQLNFDILNVGNLLNRAWGLYQGVGFNYSPVSYQGAGQYGFSKPINNQLYGIADYSSRWRAQIGVKYIF